MNKIFIFFSLILFSEITVGQAQQNLNRDWFFSLDPVSIGERQGWSSHDFNPKGWDKVQVPHSYTVDPRYHKFTGDAWYINHLTQFTVAPGHRAYIRFDAVFYKCKVWFNGNLVGEHEGGYTPFEVDVTDHYSEVKNIITVKVNNAWDTTTIPGAKTKSDYENTASSQLYPWLNYGGITRKVTFTIRPEVFIQNVKVEAVPDLAKTSANIKVQAFIVNQSEQAVKAKEIRLTISQAGKVIPLKFKISGNDIAPGAMGTINVEGTLVKGVKLWSFDDPTLYQSHISFYNDSLSTRFGIRKLEVKGTALLLNGEPIRLGGCNRPLDYPGFGSMDPKEILNKDLTLIKSGSMELSRISHYAVSEELLDWADEKGMLIIAEAGNWQMTQSQMSDPGMIENFKSQFTEMIQRDWNHPSVIAWSIGNEYQSQTEEGKHWTKTMYDFSKTLDPSRLVTFSSMIVFRESIKTGLDEASQYVDFISANIYGNYLKNLQKIHTLYPDKPVYISEFGIRADQVTDENERVKYLQNAVADFRKCDFVVGASIWTFNDYQSMYPGTNANGYRPWGLVSPERELRGMYYTWQEEFSPAVFSLSNDSSHDFQLTVTARKDLPAYTLKNYLVRVGSATYPLGVMKPGESQTINLSDPGATEVYAELIKPGGFVILKKLIKKN